MTFIGPIRVIGDLRPAPLRRRTVRLGGTPRRIDEDGARRAFGPELAMPPAVAGVSIEHLARIALG